jgi:hypothetical protein
MVDRGEAAFVLEVAHRLGLGGKGSVRRVWTFYTNLRAAASTGGTQRG